MISHGNNLKRIIQEKGLRNSFIANKMGITPCGLSQILNGKRGLSIKRADQLAEILGVPRSIILCPELNETLNESTSEST